MGVTTDYFAGKGAAKRSVSACEPYRETIWASCRGPERDGDLAGSGRAGFAGGYQSVKRLVRKLRGVPSPEARVVIETRRVKNAGRLRHWPDGARSAEWQVPAHEDVRNDTGPQPQIGTAADLAIEHPHLGRVAREGLSALGWFGAGRGSG